MSQAIQVVREQFDEAYGRVASIQDLDALRVEFLGKKGHISGLMKVMGSLSPEEKKTVGSEVNELKTYATEKMEAKTEELRKL